MTDDDLTELRRLHEAATAAPWAWEATGDKDNSWGIGVVEDADGNLIVGHNETGENGVIEPVCKAIDGNHADAALIVAMRNALPGLLAEVERLRAAAPASEDDELQRRVGAWHRSRFPDAEQHHVALKAIEELGEVAEAVNAIAGVNSATANGALSVPAEAADVVIALMVLLDRWHTADLLVEVATKLRVLEDPDSGHRSAARPAAGSPPPTPAPTAYLTPAGLRRLVEGAIFNALPLDIDRDAWAPKATDAVMALLPQPAPPTDELIRRAEAADAERDTALDTLAALSAPPLWTGKTTGHGSEDPNVSSIADEYDSVPVLPVPPGTAVEVREKRP